MPEIMRNRCPAPASLNHALYRPWLLLLLLVLSPFWAVTGFSQVPETDTLTDITAWTSNQLAALPWFAHWVPLLPAGAPPNFSAAARNGNGTVVGEVPGTTPAPNRGARLHAGSVPAIPAWGGHNWSYWSCDAEDCHFFSGAGWNTARPWT